MKEKKKGGRPATFSPTVAKKREAERNRRYAKAAYRAMKRMADERPRVYRRILEDCRAEVDAELGPLPGDAK